VELHYGKIKVESKVDEGTTFTIILPLGKDHLDPNEISKEEPASSKSSQYVPETIQSEKVSVSDNLAEDDDTSPILLIVEDNADMRSYIREYFEAEYGIIETDDGINGYKKAIEHIPDIIISDVMMPNMDGNEFCEKVKLDERTCHIPVILLTARASKESRIEGLETGADDYITKPFDGDELQVRVKNLIEQRQKLREKFVAEFWKGERSPTIQIPASDLNQMDRSFLHKALDVVGQHLSEPDFNINQFSQEMAMSRQQMHRKIRALVDQSATEFIRVIRLKKAKELLLQKTGTISEIAYDVGFNSLTYFTRSFQKYYGITPSEFIENHSKA
ncbi:MAG: response regulator, partial [Bacteroidales bacterium]|nr:response regulator [Bacteroidales bacterium]